jgi:hypothetical protein
VGVLALVTKPETGDLRVVFQQERQHPLQKWEEGRKALSADPGIGMASAPLTSVLPCPTTGAIMYSSPSPPTSASQIPSTTTPTLYFLSRVPPVPSPHPTRHPPRSKGSISSSVSSETPTS